MRVVHSADTVINLLCSLAWIFRLLLGGSWFVSIYIILVSPLTRSRQSPPAETESHILLIFRPIYHYANCCTLGIFIDDHTCRSPLSHGLFSNDSIHSFFLIVVLAYVSMYIFKASSALSDAWRLRPLWKSCLSRRTDSMPLVDNIRCRS